MHDAGTFELCACLFHCNRQLTAAPLCPKYPKLEKMMDVSKALVSKSDHGQPAWAIAMLSMLLQSYKDRDQHYQPESAKAFMQERVENVRECTRNLMSFLGARLKLMPILWSVCTAFRVLIDDPGSLETLDRDDLVATLNGCPASGACASSQKESLSHLSGECRFMGVLQDEVNKAVMALRAWRSLAYEYEGSTLDLESKLEDLELFYQDVVDHIRMARRPTLVPDGYKEAPFDR